MRRLPVFFVLDCSESMIGDNLRKMEDGLQMIVRALRTDPHALESVWLSVIAFAGVARTIVPLVDVASFYPPKLPLGSGTSLGAALRTLMAAIDTSVVRTTAERKGDWKPIVYLFTDGKPTDDVESALAEWHAGHARKAMLIAVGFGKSVDQAILRRLTDTVLVFEESDANDFKKFVAWVTASVVAQSRSVGEGADAKTTVAPPGETFLTLIKSAAAGAADDDCVVLSGRCSKSRKPYLIKYERSAERVATADFAVRAAHYDIAGCYPVDEEYFAWSDPRASGFKINTESLVGGASCPHCGNYTAFAKCVCGKLLCVNGPGEVDCPWCQKQVSFSAGTPEDGGFDVGRGRG